LTHIKMSDNHKGSNILENELFFAFPP
jgi:hypothetical protein